MVMGVWVWLGKFFSTKPAEMAVAVEAVHFVASMRPLNVGRAIGTLLRIAGNPAFRLHLLKRLQKVRLAILQFHGALNLRSACVIHLLQMLDIIWKKPARRNTMPSSLAQDAEGKGAARTYSHVRVLFLDRYRATCRSRTEHYVLHSFQRLLQK